MNKGETSVRLLMLEDEPRDMELSKAALEAAGVVFSYEHVTNGDDYARALDRGNFDAILSDYGVPRFDGMEALRLAREKVPDIPFIFVSGTIGEEAAIRTLRQGATDYVLKHQLQKLGDVVRRAVAESEARRAAQKASSALRESEEQFRTMVEQAPYAIQIMTPDGRIQAFNEAYARLWGKSREELRAMHEHYNVLEDDQAKSLGIMPLIQRAFAGESVSLPPFEYDPRKTRTARLDGLRRWVQSTIYPIRGATGEIRAVVMTLWDITSAKEAEEKARTQFNELQRWHDVTLDRESRVAELKHEVNSLLVRLGERPRYQEAGTPTPDNRRGNPA